MSKRKGPRYCKRFKLILRTVAENFSFVQMMECMEFDPGLDILLMTSRFDHAVSMLGWLSVVTYEYYDGDIVCRAARTVSYTGKKFHSNSAGAIRI